MITIDGSYGEGGGQILRTSLGLSLLTGKEFEITNIRAKREKPGLLIQHLTSVNAAVAISNAEVHGNSISSGKLYFNPGSVKGGEYNFSVGTAGSTTLVLQAILPGLLCADRESVISFEGGTHNHFAPPFDFLQSSFLRVLNKMGVDVKAEIERYGFYPAGGGKFKIALKPCSELLQLNLLERGEIKAVKATSLFSKIPEKIAHEEVQIIKRKLKLDDEDCVVKEVASPGPGNAVLVEVESENIHYITVSFGEKRLSRQQVAERALKQAVEYMASGVPVCTYLADQLLVPMVMAGGGAFRTVKPSLHTETNIEVIKQFLDIKIITDRVEDEIWEIRIGEIK